MNRVMKILPAVILFALIVSLIVPTADASAQSGVMATTTVNLRLRSGPGTGYSQVGSVPHGTTLQVLGRDEAANWLYVQYNGTSGWIAGWLTQIVGVLNSVQIIGADGSGAAVSVAVPSGGTGQVATPKVNLYLRSGAGTGYGSITVVPRGTAVTMLETSSDGQWLHVDFNGKQGWIAGWYAELSAAPIAVEITVPTVTAACDCSGNLYNCEGFSTHSEAQNCYTTCQVTRGFDVHQLDGDNDGVACEALPGAPADASRTPESQAAPEPQPGAVCDCSGNNYNCGDFGSHNQAQSCYNYCLSVRGYDVHDLDRDNDGSACESLP